MHQSIYISSKSSHSPTPIHINQLNGHPTNTSIRKVRSRHGIKLTTSTGALRTKQTNFTRMSSTFVKPAGMLSNRYKIEDMPDMSGKVAVVTGGSRGIGEAAVSALVQKGCEGVSISSMRCMDKG
jgi:hypothetical protein